MGMPLSLWGYKLKDQVKKKKERRKDLNGIRLKAKESLNIFQYILGERQTCVWANSCPDILFECELCGHTRRQVWGSHKRLGFILICSVWMPIIKFHGRSFNSKMAKNVVTKIIDKKQAFKFLQSIFITWILKDTFVCIYICVLTLTVCLYSKTALSKNPHLTLGKNPKICSRAQTLIPCNVQQSPGNRTPACF